MDDSVHSETDFPAATLSPEDPGSASRGTFSSDSAREQTGAESASGSDTEGPGAPSYGSTILSQAHHFSVSGGTFTNVTHNHDIVSTVLSDFRSIRLGDIDLREVRSETSSRFACYYRRSVRRVHSARVEGRHVTVAVYQGHGAEEEWREDIALYTSLRNPNFVQL
ncbi:hypothetical protein DFH06DRAFT_1166505 [Mycena polygramma]|nr:hypothetical protein DFH06DRAFT_1166505 [Mycena polygramma]